jgi:hypothetical protein
VNRCRFGISTVAANPFNLRDCDECIREPRLRRSAGYAVHRRDPQRTSGNLFVLLDYA